MKKKILLFIFALFPSLFYADQVVYTVSRNKVLLKEDGTWTYFTESQNKWEGTESKDPIDDSRIVIFSVNADTGAGTYGDAVTLIIRYKQNKENESWEVFINWNSYIASGIQKVTFRFDDGKAELDNSNVSTSNKATFFTDPDRIVQEIVSSTKFVVRTQPYGENSITAVFDVNGLQKLIEKYSAKVNVTELNNLEKK